MLRATEVYFGVCLGQPTTHDEDLANKIFNSFPD
jgi:hypothetical protein